MTDLRDQSWQAVRHYVETAPLVVLEETAGALMELADLADDPAEQTAELEASRPPAERLIAAVAYLILLETRFRYDSGFEALAEGLE